MDSIVDKLSDIESTAEAIVDHAETQKPVIEREIQDKRDAFDKELEEKTQAALLDIRSGLKKEMDSILDEQREKNRATIDDLLKDFDENHTKYAKKILSNIVNV